MLGGDRPERATLPLNRRAYSGSVLAVLAFLRWSRAHSDSIAAQTTCVRVQA